MLDKSIKSYYFTAINSSILLYHENKPPGIYSQHIECFWTLGFNPDDLANPNEMLSPDCTFEVLFCSEPFYYRRAGSTIWQKTKHSALFMGQKTSSFTYKTTKPIQIFGIRFKPFAFGMLAAQPLSCWNDQLVPLQAVFPSMSIAHLVQKIICIKKINKRLDVVYELLDKIVPMGIDDLLRAQTNYILDRKGKVLIKEMYSTFSTNKLSLAKNFVDKIGLSPKLVSRIWRMNNFLFLQSLHPQYNFTRLCLEVGYYDQAHFIKEFKSFFFFTPRSFYQSEPQLLRISQQGIQKRFTRQYDPVVQDF